MVGLSVCFDKTPPEPAAGFIVKNRQHLERFIVNREVASGDGYFTIPMVALALRRAKFPREETHKVVYENPRDFFQLPLD